MKKSLFLFNILAFNFALAVEPDAKTFGNDYSAAADYASRALIKQYDLELYFKSMENRAVYLMQIYTPLNPKYAAGLFVLADYAFVKRKVETDLGTMPVKNMSCNASWLFESQQFILGIRYKF